MSYQLQTGVNNPILRSVSEPVVKFSPEIKQFGHDLVRLMYKRDGVGLAAPQVGKNIRMIAVTHWKKEKIVKETLMVNPRITSASPQMIIGEEGCLSLPDTFADVKRHQSIVVEYQDLNGRKHEVKLKNMNAVVVQHEIDHLDGILFVDKAISK